MKTQDIVLLGVGLYLTYLLLKKRENIIDVAPDIVKDLSESDKEEAKTIVLNLRDTPKRKANSFRDDIYARDFDASKFSTVAPPMVTINSKDNFY